MASSKGNVHSDTARKEQIITEFFAKTIQIILESRSPFMSSRNFSGEQVVSSPSSSSSSSSSFRPRDKWFNLALRECPAALENIDFWRQSNLEPMVLDVFLVQRSIGWDPMNFSPKGEFVQNSPSKEPFLNFMNLENEDFGSNMRNEKVIERWVVQYESRKSSNTGSKKSSGNLHSLYKKSIVLLRSLYATVRLLPAYKLFRDLISSSQIRSYTLSHRISSFVEPFTRKEEADMQRFNFSPVDTSCGRICLSVLYRDIISDVNSEASTPMSPQFIPDYVGSPLADPLKRIPSLPLYHGSPSSPFSRRHSWSNENYWANSPLTLPSPSPTYSDSHGSVPKSRSHIPPPISVPHRLTETSHVGNKTYGFDECWAYNVFSPSPSPSPPMYNAKTNATKVLFRCESAPDSIPGNKAFNNQIVPPSPPYKLTRAATLRSNCASIEKSSLGRDESGRYSGSRMSFNSSPRSSSRRSTQDDFDDTEFACPFVVDYDEMMSGRPGAFDQKGQPYDPLIHGGSGPVRKSQDAEVGALVLLLNRAPPLHKDSLLASKTGKVSKYGEELGRKPESQESQEGPNETVLSSTLGISKTTADAMEELQTYKKMKDFLLSQGNNKSRVFRENENSSSEGTSQGKHP